MANRYDRDPDDYGFGQRDPRDRSRDDEDRRHGPYAQGHRYEDERQGVRQSAPWRDVRNENRGERDYRRFDQDYRGGGRDYAWGRDNWGRDQWGRENAQNRGYYSSGRDYPSYATDRDRGHDRFERERGQGERERGWQNDTWRRGERENSGDYRGLYQEQVWTRDPSSGNVYGYEYSTRIDPRRFNQGDETRDRWRSESDQNRRFDIDRGWYTPGTSGYGNTGFQSQYGRGPKGYTRSDERIREDVCDRLSDDDEVDARDVTVTVKNAEVILEGTVTDRRSKHRAEDIAESVSGVKEVTNHLRARKGFFQELGDKISGDDEAEHHGHRGSGTRNSTTGTPGGAPQKTSH